MANYLLLYSGGKMPESEAEQKAVMQDWEAWYEKVGGAVVDAGNPFTPAAKTISSSGAVSNGSMGAMASGYTILKANSLDEAVSMAKSCPVLKGGASITVYETFDVMGM
jgi:hypothetical protein